MKYGIFDDIGLPIGFYDTQLHGTPGEDGCIIPDEASLLTDAQWAEFIENTGERIWDPIANGLRQYYPVFDYDTAKSIKQSEIRTEFSKVENLPYTDPNGVTWNGGYYSAIRMDSLIRFAEIVGNTSTYIYDVENVSVPTTLDEAKAIMVGIANQYQAYFDKKQHLMNAINMIAEPGSQRDFDAIIVSY